MRASGIPYAGIVLPDPAAFDLQRALADAAEVLRRLDGASGEPLRRSSKRAAVMADRLGIAIRPPEPGGPRGAGDPRHHAVVYALFWNDPVVEFL